MIDENTATLNNAYRRRYIENLPMQAIDSLDQSIDGFSLIFLVWQKIGVTENPGFPKQ